MSQGVSIVVPRQTTNVALKTRMRLDAFGAGVTWATTRAKKNEET